MTIADVLSGAHQWWIDEGDCLDVLPRIPAQSIAACVCDPPYDLRSGSGNGSGGFMGMKWDGTGVAFRAETWAEVRRVMIPGAHLVAFGGQRTYHRLAVAIEDAGFELRDCLQWIFATGFPKSLDLGWGWGTALKPAYEPIVLARVPLAERTTKGQFLATGTGGINVDGGRVEVLGSRPGRAIQEHNQQQSHAGWGTRGASPVEDTTIGRWPPNLIFAHAETCELVGTKRVAADGHFPADRGPGGLGTIGHSGQTGLDESSIGMETVEDWRCAPDCPVAELDRQSGADTGGASRFFPTFHYEPKAAFIEREIGLAAFPRRSAGEVTGGRAEGSAGLDSPRTGAGRTRGARNHHPTVKPVDLMAWLVRLVTPAGGIVLDPFVGSGSTIMAAQRLGFRAIGIELDPEYTAIARARVTGDAPLFNQGTGG